MSFANVGGFRFSGMVDGDMWTLILILCFTAGNCTTELTMPEDYESEQVCTEIGKKAIQFNTDIAVAFRCEEDDDL